MALSYGLIAAAELSGLPLFLGSYPITPASDILHELSKHKSFGVTTFQAEDEIAGIGAALGASFGGKKAMTATSGPGMSLKTEMLGLASIAAPHGLPVAVSMLNFDMWVMFAFGVIGYLMRKLKFPAAPVVLALVLGPMVERTLRQSLTISHGDITIFFTRPISAVLVTIALISLCAPLLRGVMDWRKKVVEIS